MVITNQTGTTMNNQAYFNIKTYCDDLTERLRLVEEWKLRHPDWNTQPFLRDESNWIRADDDAELTFETSFDPNDLRPNTSDLLTSERWNDLMLVALSAFEVAGEVERLRRTIKVLEYTLEANEDTQNES
jgi:hypothetical protein